MSREETHTRERALIDRHFARRSTLANESVMRDHVATCETCRQYYERHLMIADLDPTSPPAKERIAAGLGFSPAAPPRRLGRPILTFAGAATVFAMLLVAGRQLTPDGDFVARGGGSGPRGIDLPGAGLSPDANNAPELRIYVVNPEDPEQSRPLGLEIGATDELAFTYANPTGFRWLMVLGVDENRKIYWFHPAWNDQTRDPRAVSIDPGVVPRELPEAITHAFTGGTLRILGLFADHELSVRDVERVVDFAGCSALGEQLGKVVCVEWTVAVSAAASAPR